MTSGIDKNMLTMSPILRDKRSQLFKMADAYWREIRPTGDHCAPRALVFWQTEGFEAARYQMRKMLS